MNTEIEAVNRMRDGKKLQLGIEWAIALLITLNFLLMLLFLGVLLGGSITDGIDKYITSRYLYAPIVALFASSWPLLWKGIKWLAEPHLPGSAKQRRLYHIVLGRFRKLIPCWKPASVMMIV